MTSPENTICYPPDQLSYLCPITSIKFVDSEGIVPYQSDAENYTVKPINADKYLVYSKTSTDNLPIVKTSVDASTPCFNPEIISMGSLYPLEMDNEMSTCEFDLLLQTDVDNRFTDTGGQVSEYDVQNDSGVLAMLNELHLIEDYAPESMKRETEYKLWTRPTISWKIECDTDLPRQIPLDSYSNGDASKARKANRKVWKWSAFALVLTGTFVCGGCAIACSL